MLDDVIDRHTAVCDLPRHSQCGLVLTTINLTHQDDEDNSEMVVVWNLRHLPQESLLIWLVKL